MAITSPLFPLIGWLFPWPQTKLGRKENIGSPNMTLSAISVMRTSQKRDTLWQIFPGNVE